MQRRTFLAFQAALLAGMPAWGQIANLNEAINKAGRQRMLSQRTAKAYLALLLEVEPDKARQVMDQSMSLFDRQLVELKAFSPAAAIRETFVRLEKSWVDYKEMLVGKAPSQSGAEAVLRQVETILQMAHEGANQLEKVAGKSSGHLVNLTGRQRMLSQRLAVYYFAATAQINTQAATAAIAQARNEFVSTMNTLREAPETNDAVRAELKLGDEQWAIFDAALQRVDSGAQSKRLLSNVFITSENLLKVMDSVTALYVRMG